jgi:hypothetical protein
MMGDREYTSVDRGHVPTTPLTYLADEMAKPLDRPECSAVRAIIMLDDGGHAGILIQGYDDEREALANIVMHAQAMFAALGLRMDIVSIPDSPEGL